MIQYETKESYFLIKLRMEYLDARVADQVKSDLQTLIDETEKNLITIDLSSVEFIDSSGFGVLISCLKKCKSDNKELTLSCLTPQAKLCFSMLNLDKLFKILEKLP